MKQCEKYQISINHEGDPMERGRYCHGHGNQREDSPSNGGRTAFTFLLDDVDVTGVSIIEPTS